MFKSWSRTKVIRLWDTCINRMYKVFNVYFIVTTPFSNSNGHHQSHSDAEDMWTRYEWYGREYEFLAATTITVSVVYSFLLTSSENLAWIVMFVRLRMILVKHYIKYHRAFSLIETTFFSILIITYFANAKYLIRTILLSIPYILNSIRHWYMQLYATISHNNIYRGDNFLNWII